MSDKLAATLMTLCFVSISLTFCEKVVDTNLALHRTLRALEKGLDFFAEEHRSVNLDAVIGTRLVEGQLKVLLRHLNKADGYEVSDDTYRYIQQLQSKADRVSRLCTPYVKATQPKYYQRIGPILEPAFWTLDKYPSRDVQRELVTAPRIEGEALHEEASDDCLTELFGTGSKSKDTCQVSKRCWYMMTQPGYRGYSLSHEVFYLQIGQMFGCFRGSVLDVIDKLNEGFCANMYKEATEIAQNNFPVQRRDLFMEIPALCGMLGYRQFFHDDWLEQILSWQRPRGCWGVTREDMETGPLDPRYRFKKSGEKNGRFKREEKNLRDGCQCHRTAVALGALTQYIRYIIEYMNVQQNLIR